MALASGLAANRLVERIGQTHADDAGVGNHHVDLTELDDSSVDGGSYFAEVADVGHGGPNAPTGVPHQIGGLGKVGLGGQRVGDRSDVGTPVDGDDVHSPACEGHRGFVLAPAQRR
jgi:hypothetical protein